MFELHMGYVVGCTASFSVRDAENARGFLDFVSSGGLFPPCILHAVVESWDDSVLHIFPISVMGRNDDRREMIFCRYVCWTRKLYLRNLEV